MKHSLTSEGFGVRLRPVRLEDAGFIVWLRNQDYAKGKIGDSLADIPGQRRWLQTYFERPGDYYFIIETPGGIPVGTHSVYGVCNGEAELGRWVIRKGIPAAIPSQCLALNLAFETLQLKRLRAAMVVSNRAVCSICRSFGFHEVGMEAGGRIIGGKATDITHYLMAAEDWAAPRQRLLPKAELAHGLILQWEESRFTSRRSFQNEA